MFYCDLNGPLVFTGGKKVGYLDKNNCFTFRALHEFQNMHAQSKERIHEFIRGHFYGWEFFIAFFYLNPLPVFLYPLKTPENLWSSDVFRGYSKRLVAPNGSRNLLVRFFFYLSFNPLSANATTVLWGWRLKG